eukprot:6205349-Pleurochrysis_carterae.AAC.3
MLPLMNRFATIVLTHVNRDYERDSSLCLMVDEISFRPARDERQNEQSPWSCAAKCVLLKCRRPQHQKYASHGI